MKIYILDQRRDEKKNNAVGKAMTDVFAIMGKCGVKTLPGVPKNANKLLKVFDFVTLTWYSLFVLGSKDYCIFVYQDNAAKIKLLSKLKKIRCFKVICLVNDVNSIRSDGLYSEKRKHDIDRDFELIGSADIILAPNKGSIKYMKERGITAEMIPVGVWDYLMDDSMGDKCDENAAASAAFVKRAHYEKEAKEGEINLYIDPEKGYVNAPKWKVGFAGNLDKSEFLPDIVNVYDETVEYHLWGDKGNNTYEYRSVIYEGSVSPNVLPLEISEKCHFGLAWDGDTAGKISGGYGEYLRFNNSHKCGCYLASGIPVFVWKESGMAYFVRENKCGFLIDGLDDIGKILSRMTVNEYDRLLENTRKAAELVRAGHFLKSALCKSTGMKEETFDE